MLYILISLAGASTLREGTGSSEIASFHNVQS